MRLTDQEIDDIKQTAPVYVSAKAVNAIVPMVEAKLIAKREWVGIVARDANRILFNDRYKALLKTDAVALANFLTEVEDTLREKNA